MKKDPKFPIEMGERIRQARRDKKYTIEQLAEMADVAPQYISEVERGKKAFGSENLRAVSLALERSTDFFIYGIGDADPKRASILEQLVALPPVDQAYAVKLLESVLDIVKSVDKNEEKMN